MTIAQLAQECEEIARDKGFNLAAPTQQLLLIATEVAEALDHVSDPHPNEVINDYRNIVALSLSQFNDARKTTDIPDSTEIRDRGKLAEELADTVIRVLTFSSANGIDIQQAVLEKMDVNRGREKLHGKRW